MLYAISGSQGCGKTTVLNELKQRGCNVIERKTSRSILSDWNVTLEEVNNNHELTIKFQEEIINRKYQDEIDAVMSKDVWFTERSFADLFTYALGSLGKDNKYSDWLDLYYVKCTRLQQMYSAVFYILSGHFKIEHDGVRGSNHYYSRMIDVTMREITEDMSSKMIPISTPNLKIRVDDILHDCNLI